MKLGFICLNLPGHLNPMTALARQLQGRNHEVVFLYSSSANGLPCVPGDDKDPINENRPEVSKLQGDDAFGFGVGLLMQRTEAMLKSMPEMLEATAVECPHHRPDPSLCRNGADELGHTLYPRGGGNSLCPSMMAKAGTRWISLGSD